MTLRRLFDILKLSFQEWSEDRASVLGAALAYYMIFSIGPLLVAIMGIVGLVLGPEAASGQIKSTLEGSFGASGAETIQGIVAGASRPTAGIIATVLGVLGVVFGAIAIFGQLKSALNIIWEAPEKKGTFLEGLLSNVAMFALVIASALVLLLSILATAFVSSVEKFAAGAIPGGPILWQILNFMVSLGLVTLMFAIIFRALPDVKIPWKDVWLGSFITAILFLVGQILIGIYIGFTDIGSSYGAASSLVVILVYIYYSAQIIFLGAEITQVYANTYGSKMGEKEAWALRLPALGRKGEDEEKKPEVRKSPWFST